METVTLQQILDQTGLSRQSVYMKANKGELVRVGKNSYTKESADALVEKRNSKADTIAPTRTGVSKDKLALLAEYGFVTPDAHGRYTEEDIRRAKQCHVSRRKDGTIAIIIHTGPKKQKSVTLKDMEDKSGIKKPTLLHYVRSGKIEKIGDNAYSAKSFNKFLKDYNNLKATSLVKAQVMDELGIDNAMYNKLLHAHKLEKASFERYTQESVDKLKDTPQDEWFTDATPTYKGIPVSRAYTGRKLPEDQILTYQQVKEMINREKSTIVHLVKEGKIELVGKNKYAKDSVERYLEQRDGKKDEAKAEPETEEAPVIDVKAEEAQPEPEPTPEYYTASEVKKLLGIGQSTHLNYYVKKGFFARDGKNKYPKASVDKYIASKQA